MSDDGNKPLHRRRKSMSAHLSTDLREEYGFRSIPIRRGDKVRLLRGDFEGMEGEVTGINTKNRKIIVEGLETATADGTEVSAPVHYSNVEITRLEKDKMREKIIERKTGGEIVEIPEREEEPEEEPEEEAEEVKEVEEPDKEIEEEAIEEPIKSKISLEQSIKDIKDAIKEREEVDYEELLKAEKKGKNRKTLIEWLERKIEK